MTKASSKGDARLLAAQNAVLYDAIMNDKKRPQTVSAAVPADHASVTISPMAQTAVATAGVVGFALLTALGAQVYITLPGTPVPMTLQTLVVVMAGLTLGARLGTLSMLLYLLLGTLGYQVFSENQFGFQPILGSTGGYLIGFALAQPLLGKLSKMQAIDGTAQVRKWPALLASIAAGNAIIFACGLTWLAIWMQADLMTTLQAGLFPFIPGLLLKSAAALGVGHLVVPGVRRVFDRV